MVTAGQLAGQRHRASAESSFICAANYLPSRNVINARVTKKNKHFFSLQDLIYHQRVIITKYSMCHISRVQEDGQLTQCESVWKSMNSLFQKGIRKTGRSKEGRKRYKKYGKGERRGKSDRPRRTRNTQRGREGSCAMGKLKLLEVPETQMKCMRARKGSC